jgi:hypothetical protein
MITIALLVNPKLLLSSRLALTTAVLGATDYDNTIFRMNLNNGGYILVFAATCCLSYIY